MAKEQRNSAWQPANALDLCRTIAETSPIPTAQIDAASRTITSTNLAFCLLMGKSREQLAGAPVSSLGPPDDDFLDLVDRAVKTAKPVRRECVRLIGPSQTFGTYTLWPVVDAGDRTTSLLLQITEASATGEDAVLVNEALVLGALRQQDLLEAAQLLNYQLRAEMLVRQEAELALVRSEKLAVVGRMAAVLAHEINNPLFAVTCLLYLAETDAGTPPHIVEYIQQADAQLKRVSHIARQAFGFYRETGEAASFEVKPMLESVLNLLGAKVRSVNANVQLECDSGTAIHGRYGEVRQMISNLLLNSLEAIEDGGRVVIRARPLKTKANVAGRVAIVVSDNGKGVPLELVHRMFEAFFTTKGSVGNGLGLWICKQIVVKHGGTFRIRSNTSGHRRGTTLAMSLPAGG